MDKDLSTKKRIETWLEGPYDEDTKNEIRRLLKEHSKELLEDFSSNLDFGTGGIRAKMGIGTNKVNKYTIGIATQALCNYILAKKEKNPSILIGFDSRKNSDFFAKEAAKVIAANKIQVYLFKELRPTPLISFGCRYKNCTSAIMITASHNPKDYNGYKVYWKDGGQVLPPHDVGIIEEFNKINSFESVKILDSIDHPLIEMIEDELDIAYTEKLFSIPLFQKKEDASDLSIIYSSLHGTGITLTPQCLNKAGFDNITIVKEQEKPDPNFTNAPKPNPEEEQALEIGIRYLLEKNADIFIANDPDADRMGVVINHKGEKHIFTGHQIASIMLDFLCKEMKLYSKTAAIKSIVTSELLTRICEFYDIHMFDVLTGFKYIAEKMHEWEMDHSYEFIFGAEESLGYLAETFVRDKDAVSASILISKIALMAKRQHKTLLDLLFDIYKQHGIFREKLTSIAFESTEAGMEKMKDIMEKIRCHPPTQIANTEVLFLDDYKKRITLDLKNNTQMPIILPESNVLRFWLSDNSKVIIRPSGTEPKVKIYVEMQELNIKDMENDIRLCDERLDALISAIRIQIKS